MRDIDHFRKDEPLDARPDRLSYTVGKFARRNWKVLSTAAAMTAIVAAVAVMLGMSLRSADSPLSANIQQRNPEAYDLFLRSAGGRYDPGPKNVEQIQMIERAVALDPTYSPAWLALSRRYLVESRYGNGSEALLKMAVEANERALALDPGLVAAGGRLAILHTERGELVSAFREAQELVRRRPDSPDAYFAYSYVLRFAGLMQEAARACSTAMSLDPHNWGWRSCVSVSLALGDHEGARGYIQLDLGSEWAKALTIHTLVHEGKPDDALKVEKPIFPQWKSYDVLLACLNHKPEPEIRRLAAAVPIDTDPEVNYYAAAHLSYCGETEAALRLLKTAVQGGYCSYPAIETDPFFTRIRGTPEYDAVRSAGMACQNAFLEQRARL